MLFGNRRPRIKRKSAEDIDGMRKAGKLASQCLQEIAEQVAPGMTTQDIDDLQMDFAKRHGVELAQLNYGGSRHVSPFPKSICTSIDEVICHGIPSDRELKEGETVGLDVTIIVDGYYGDNATTIAVGDIDEDGKRLLDVTLESLRRGIQAVRPGGFLGDIGFAIQSYAEAEGFSVVRDFVGHGIGTEFHEEPQVPHYGKKGRGTRLAPGMTFTIEPMINEGTWRSKVLEDGWTAVTTDGKRSAQYEHTIAVTKDGVEIMTVQNDDGSWEPPGRIENWR
jgi:methionyl aminopeptidase